MTAISITPRVELLEYSVPPNIGGLPADQVRGVFTDAGVPGWRFELVLDDQLQVASVTVTATGGIPIGQRRLRAAHLDVMRQRLAATAAEFARGYRAGLSLEAKRAEADNDRTRAYAARVGVEPVGTRPVSPMRQLVDANEEPRRNPGRPVQWTDERLARLASDYVAACDAGAATPNRVVGSKWGYSAVTVAQCLTRARRTDPPILSPTVRGRAGGVLTGYGASLVAGGAT
ncbi:MAG: hypothetical protein JST73_10850 [Actinobacteria bacterium]|nr:hypothetical protein [Actinomycetota bacterium]